MKKIVIVNCFDTYEDRIDLLNVYFEKRGYNVTVIQSNFRHFKKTFRDDSKKNFIFINTKPYFKNMSFERLTSHFLFAKHAFKHVEKHKPDLIYVTLPPNSLALFSLFYKRKRPEVKLIFDIIDLWPETMPIKHFKHLFPFKLWGGIRDFSLKSADYVITECNLYQLVLKNKINHSRTGTVYLAKKHQEIKRNPLLDERKLNLCYLGSINNIIDIEKIAKIIGALNVYKDTTLHIIGDGENKKILIDAIIKLGVEVKDHGKIYDQQKKQEIFDNCHYGLNIMKDSVCVGLTMKSIDYFQHGIPIINNIQEDTSLIVDKYKVGFNITNETFANDVKKILNVTPKETFKMRKRTQNVFDKYFSQKSFESKIGNIIDFIKI